MSVSAGIGPNLTGIDGGLAWWVWPEVTYLRHFKMNFWLFKTDYCRAACPVVETVQQGLKLEALDLKLLQGSFERNTAGQGRGKAAGNKAVSSEYKSCCVSSHASGTRQLTLLKREISSLSKWVLLNLLSKLCCPCMVLQGRVGDTSVFEDCWAGVWWCWSKPSSLPRITCSVQNSVSTSIILRQLAALDCKLIQIGVNTGVWYKAFNKSKLLK